MPLRKHPAPERIAYFFEKYCHFSQVECDSLAATILGTSGTPSTTQGAFSYTIKGSNQVVQFRAEISPLNIHILNLAKEIHGLLVARTFQWGSIGGRDKGEGVVGIYCMEKLDGVNYSLIEAPSQISLSWLERQERTVNGLAR
jgi:hypothetical protein